MEKEALLYTKRNDNSVECILCSHRCVIKPGAKGICSVRENVGGNLFTLSYGNLIAQHADPIEKKPLFHFLPGSYAWSIAAPGCNFRCQWCQNWEISQLPRLSKQRSDIFVHPEQVVIDAIAHHCLSIAYTYTEPTIFFEYTADVAQYAIKNGLRNVYVTNGYMSKEMIDISSPWLDAANVDIKAFSERTYKKYARAHLQPVLDSCKLMRSKGIWLEITTLVIPGVNDDLSEMRDLAKFIYHELGENTPWHISRYFPSFQFESIPPTPIDTIETIELIGKEIGLHYVYSGNLSNEVVTFCPNCGEELIIRIGNALIKNNIAKGDYCVKCGYHIAGIELSTNAHS
jgi:pyruvate formate lyase activating enzyme